MFDRKNLLWIIQNLQEPNYGASANMFQYSGQLFIHLRFRQCFSLTAERSGNHPLISIFVEKFNR